MLEKHQSELIEHAMAVGALKFGSFTLKSGRYRSRWHLNSHLRLTDQNLYKDLPVLLQCGSDKFRVDARDAVCWIRVANPFFPRVI